MTHATSAILNVSINTLCYHLPLVGHMNIDWGDGTSSDVDSLFSTDGVIHFYESVGTYKVTVKGSFTALEHHSANRVTSVTTDTEEVINALLGEGVDMIRVSLKDLPVTWEVHNQTRRIMSKECGLRSDITSGYFEHCDHCQGAGCYEDKKYTLVISPRGNTMLSLEHDSLVFDNIPANNSFTNELDCNKVPYVVSK